MKLMFTRRWLAALMALGLLLGMTACGEREPEQTTAAPETTVEATTEPTTVPTTVPEETEPEEERFWLTFVGDCTFGASPANYYAQLGFVKTVGEDYGYPFRNVIEWFEGDEFSFINLEGPLCDSGGPVQKTHTFHGPTDFVNIITQNSVEFVSLANNHTLDYAQSGYDSTVKTLQEAGVPYVERDASTIVTTPNGLKIGVYGAVYYHLDVEDMTAEIGALKEAGCDLIVYAPHWGFEKTYSPTEEQVFVGHAAIDAGADIVWGSHPHALQPVESYGDGIIYYSMGNFSFGGNAMPEDFDTAIIQQEVIRDGEGALRLGQTKIIPCSISSVDNTNNYQPTPLERSSEAYARVLAKLGGTWSR